jgi:primosomal replication protein N
VTERGALRYTPAGVEALDLRVNHASAQALASHVQLIELELQCVAFSLVARKLQHVQTGQLLHLAGYMMPNRRGSRTLKLNITECIVEPEHGLFQENRP